MVKVEDSPVREWLTQFFLPKQKCIKNWECTANQFEWYDLDVTSDTDTHYYIEVKTRTVKSTDYGALTMIEQDKFNKFWENRGRVALLILFTDCICWFPPSRLFDAFTGIAIKYNCADEQHPTTTKEWKRVPKAVGLFDTNKAVKFSYDNYGGTPTHLFKSPYSG